MAEQMSQVSCVGGHQPKSWDDYERGCLLTFSGGYDGGLGQRAFQHGMQTVFNLLRSEFPPAEQCKAAPLLLEACKAAQEHIGELVDAWQRGVIDERDGKSGTRSNRNWDIEHQLRAAIAAAEG